MILSGIEIGRMVAAGAITIEPFDPSQLNPNSYNYRLGSRMKVVDQAVCDPHSETKTNEIVLSERGYLFQPDKIYLANTEEIIGSSQFVPTLIGRSSLGRLGVFLQISADLGNLGAIHRWTLEIVVCQPIILYPGMKVGQVSFWNVKGDVTPYSGIFGTFCQAEPSRPEAFESKEVVIEQ